MRVRRWFVALAAVTLASQGAARAIADRPIPEPTRGWDFPAAAGLEGSVTAIAPDPHVASRIYVGASGVFRSDDFGSTWQRLDGTLRPTRLVVDPSSSNRLYALEAPSPTPEDGTLWRSVDGGATWAGSATPAPVDSVVVDAAGTVYANTWHGLFRSHDIGRDDTWIQAGLAADGGAVAVVKADPRLPGVVYGLGRVFGQDALYASVDEGASWAGPIVGPIPNESVVSVEPGSATLYVGISYEHVPLHGNPAPGYGEVRATSDGGSTWMPVFRATRVARALPDPARPGTLYVAVPSSSDGRPAVYQVSPGGTSVFGLVGVILLQIEISPDGSVLYAVTDEGRLTRRRTDTGRPRIGVVPFR